MENKFKKLTGVVPLEIAEVNDCVQFGKYAWKVICVEDGKKLLISKECLVPDFDWEFGQKSFEELFKELEETNTEEDNIEEAYTEGDFLYGGLSDDMVDDELDLIVSTERFDKTYGACKKGYENVQKYLRERFYIEYFSPEEIKRIVPYSTKANGQMVSDYVFLLSKEEVEKYIPQKEERITTVSTDMYKDVEKPWLLRYDDETGYCFSVDTNGEIIVPNGCIDQFRPAVWVKS